MTQVAEQSARGSSLREVYWNTAYKFADYVDETVKVYFLGGLGVLRGIYPSF